MIESFSPYAFSFFSFFPVQPSPTFSARRFSRPEEDRQVDLLSVPSEWLEIRDRAIPKPPLGFIGFLSFFFSSGQ